MRDAARVGFAPLTHDATGVGKVAAARVLARGGVERVAATPTVLRADHAATRGVRRGVVDRHQVGRLDPAG